MTHSLVPRFAPKERATAPAAQVPRRAVTPGCQWLGSTPGTAVTDGGRGDSPTSAPTESRHCRPLHCSTRQPSERTGAVQTENDPRPWVSQRRTRMWFERARRMLTTCGPASAAPTKAWATLPLLKQPRLGPRHRCGRSVGCAALDGAFGHHVQSSQLRPRGPNRRRRPLSTEKLGRRALRWARVGGQARFGEQARAPAPRCGGASRTRRHRVA